MQEINVFELEKPQGLRDLLAQMEFISQDMKKWTDSLIRINNTARKDIEIISEDHLRDAFHNLSQNVIDLAKLIQKKIQEV